MKKWMAIITTATLITGLTLSPAMAGSARKHTIEGIIIGASAALIGTAIAQNMSHNEPVVAYMDAPRHRDKRWNKGRHWDKREEWRPTRRGHWESRKVWVPPEFETRWNPAHYNRRGDWVEGHHKKFLVCKGYWKTQRVWINDNIRR